MQAPVDLSEAAIQASLHTNRYGRGLTVLTRTGSTNDTARKDAEAGALDGHTVVADTQDSGRGSRGRRWLSPPGDDLYLSVVARVPVELSQLAPLTLAAGLAVADTVDATLGAARARVKWPNDVWVDGRKIAGILVEGQSTGVQLAWVVIGIGLNVNRPAFPDDLDTPATSLALCGPAGARHDRNLVLARLLDNLERWVDRFIRHGAAPIVDGLNPRLALRGARVRCGDAIGTVAGVARSGALLLHTGAGTETVFSARLEPLA